MATIQSSNRLALRALLLRAGADQAPGTQGPTLSVLQTLACTGRRLLGAALLLLGILLMSTLVLLPVGLPLALLAVALIAAPGSPGPDVQL
jgi:hypothetical protein